jgi:hypothetical protein
MREQVFTKKGKGLWPQDDFRCTAPEPLIAEIKSKSRKDDIPASVQHFPSSSDFRKI